MCEEAARSFFSEAKVHCVVCVLLSSSEWPSNSCSTFNVHNYREHTEEDVALNHRAESKGLLLQPRRYCYSSFECTHFSAKSKYINHGGNSSLNLWSDSRNLLTPDLSVLSHTVFLSSIVKFTIWRKICPRIFWSLMSGISIRDLSRLNKAMQSPFADTDDAWRGLS